MAREESAPGLAPLRLMAALGGWRPVVVHRLGGDRADDGGLYAAVERGDAAALAHHLDELVGDELRGGGGPRVPRASLRVAIVEPMC